MSAKKKNHFSGVAGLFDAIELKRFFINYLYFIIGVEILIFLVSFLGNLGPDKGPFPWKFYFYVAFVAPVAVTFLMGVFILAFNQYLFGVMHSKTEGEGSIEDDVEEKGQMLKIGTFLTHMRQVPFLPMLFLLISGAVLVYKMDDIFTFMVNAGEKVISYILIGAGVILAVGLVIGIIWVVTNYKLSRKHMEHEYKYRNDVMEKLGFLILDDDTVIDRNGKTVNQKLLPPSDDKETIRDTLKILPPSN